MMLNSQDLLQHAKATLNDETSTDERKTAAQKAIDRINSTAKKPRPRRPKLKDFATTEEHARALFEFRSKLDRAAREREASAILDDPTSSSYLRKKARVVLYGEDPEPGPTEPVKTAESESPEKPQHSRLDAEAQALNASRVKAFLDSLGQPGQPAETPTRLETPAKVEPASRPIDPKLNCESCRTLQYLLLQCPHMPAVLASKSKLLPSVPPQPP